MSGERLITKGRTRWQPEAPEDWVRQSAAEKAAWLTDAIAATAYSSVSRPPLGFPPPREMPAAIRTVLSTEELSRTLDHTGDFMPEGRPKIIHTQGTIAAVELETDDNSPWTGLLASPANGGGALGILRLSLAAPPGPGRGHVPGLGLKLFIDGHPSADVCAVNHTNGQGRDSNLFANDLTHDLSDTHDQLRRPQAMMGQLFKRVSIQPRRLSIAHLVERDRSGAIIAEPAAPEKIVFRPCADVRDLFDGRHGEDYRQTLRSFDHADCAHIYELRHGPDGQLIGRLRLRTGFIDSKAGDRVFFRHVQDPADRR